MFDMFYVALNAEHNLIIVKCCSQWSVQWQFVCVCVCVCFIHWTGTQLLKKCGTVVEQEGSSPSPKKPLDLALIQFFYSVSVQNYTVPNFSNGRHTIQ